MAVFVTHGRPDPQRNNLSASQRRDVGRLYSLQHRAGNDGSGYFDPIVEILVGDSFTTAVALDQYTDQLMPTHEAGTFEAWRQYNVLDTDLAGGKRALPVFSGSGRSGRTHQCP